MAVLWWLFPVLQLCTGAMEGPLVSSFPFYNTFRDMSSLRCSKAMGTGTQPDKLVNNQQNRDIVKASLSQTGQQFFQQLLDSTDFDFSIFTIDEARLRIYELMNLLNAEGRLTYANINTQFEDIHYASLTSTLKSWPIAVHLVLTEERFCNLLSRMDEALLGVLCTRLTENEASVAVALEYVNRCAYCVGLAIKTRQNVPIRLVGQKAQAMKDKILQYKPNQWDDVYYFMMIPSALNEADIDRVDTTNFCSDQQLVQLTDEMFYMNLKPGVKKAIAHRMKFTCYNKKIDQLTTAELRQFAKYVIHLPYKTIVDEASVAAVIANIDVFKNLTDILKTDFLNALAELIPAYWSGSAGSLSDNDKIVVLCTAVKYLGDRDFFKNSVVTADLLIALENFHICNNFDVTPDEAAVAIEVYIASTGFTWTASKANVLGHLMAHVKRSVFEEMGSTFMCDNWAAFHSTPFPDDVLALFWANCKSDFTGFSGWDRQKLQEAGSFLSMLSKAEIESLPDDAVYEGRKNFQIVAARTGLCARKPAICKLLVQKIKTHVDSDSSIKWGQTVAEFSFYFMNALNNTDIENINLADITDWSKINFDGKTAAALWKKISSSYGEISTSNVKYSASQLSDKSTMMVKGATAADLAKLPENDAFFDVLHLMAESFEYLKGKKKEVILKKLKSMFGIQGSVSKKVCIDGALVEEVGMYFGFASIADLSKLSVKTLRDVLKSIGEKYKFVQVLSPPKIRSIFRVMMKLEGLDSASSYTIAHLNKFGPYLWCGMKSSQVPKLSDEALSRYKFELGQCIHFDSATRKAFVDRAEGVDPATLMDQGFLHAMGHFLPDTVDGVLAYVDARTTAEKAKMKNMIEVIFNRIALFRQRLLMKDKNVIKPADVQAYVTKVNQLAAGLAEKLVVTAARRRRRSNAVYTCEDLKDFDGNLGFLTASHINAMAAKDVADCASQFQNDTFAADVLAAMGDQLVSHFGSPSSWTASHIQSANQILDGLSTSEITSLTFTTDTISYLKSTEFEQSAAIVTSYLSDTSVSDPATLDSGTLSQMGWLMCGYTVANINAMDKTALYAAAPDICYITCMSPEQLEAFGNKLVAEIGTNWMTVDPSIIEALGVCMGGLPANSLTSLTNEQIGSLDPQAIKSMPTSVFSQVFDETKIQELSTDQVNAVTDAQKQQLPSAALATLNTKASLVEDDITSITTTDDVTTPGPDNGFPRMQCSTVLVTLMLGVLTFAY